mmetsp:Transcript_12012/g.17607  ORF Transcript_12012/g.17607 Transcript_12012/m.17607 type:complete len:332 (+) Transcript_12012:155-1150(+)
MKIVLAYFLVFAPLSVISKQTRCRLTWVNGIAYNIDHVEQEKGDISKYFGGEKVDFCFNPSAMKNTEDTFGYAADLTQATTQKFGRITDEVNALVKHLKEAVLQVGKKGVVVHIAHSQGALLTYLAAKQLSPLEMSKIEVIAFGGAAALRRSQETPFARVINYYSVNDPLLLVVPPAAEALKSGFENEEFCFLAPRIGNPINDHYLLGPTYAQALAWEGKRFQQQYHSIIRRSTRPVLIFCIALFRAILVRLECFIKKLVQITFVPIFQVFLRVWNLLQSTILKPVVALLTLLWVAIFDIIQNFRQEEKYQPANVALKLANKEKEKKKKKK